MSHGLRSEKHLTTLVATFYACNNVQNGCEVKNTQQHNMHKCPSARNNHKGDNLFIMLLFISSSQTNITLPLTKRFSILSQYTIFSLSSFFFFINIYRSSQCFSSNIFTEAHKFKIHTSFPIFLLLIFDYFSLNIFTKQSCQVKYTQQSVVLYTATLSSHLFYIAH